MKKRKDGRYCKTATVHGKKMFFYGETKSEANKKAEEYLYNLENPIVYFRSVAEEWAEIYEKEVAYKTWATYKGHLNRLIEAFGEEDITKLSHLDVHNMLKSMANQKYADKTVRTRRTVCNMIMEHAMFKKYISTNPCSIVSVPKGLKRTPRELPETEEIERVINNVNSHFGLFAYFLLFTGMRRGEALAIRWDDINFKNNSIYIHQSVYFASNRPKTKSTKTTCGTRTIPLLAPLRQALNCIIPHKGYVFGGTAPLTEQAYRRAWERYKKESGVTITPHQLRHAYATILYDAKISAKSAQKLLGHADYKTTLEIYTHISERRKEEDTEKLNDFTSGFTRQISG